MPQQQHTVRILGCKYSGGRDAHDQVTTLAHQEMDQQLHQWRQEGQQQQLARQQQAREFINGKYIYIPSRDQGNRPVSLYTQSPQGYLTELTDEVDLQQLSRYIQATITHNRTWIIRFDMSRDRFPEGTNQRRFIGEMQAIWRDTNAHLQLARAALTTRHEHAFYLAMGLGYVKELIRSAPVTRRRSKLEFIGTSGPSTDNWNVALQQMQTWFGDMLLRFFLAHQAELARLLWNGARMGNFRYISVSPTYRGLLRNMFGFEMERNQSTRDPTVFEERLTVRLGQLIQRGEAYLGPYMR
jgi:hypothetical protein